MCNIRAKIIHRVSLFFEFRFARIFLKEISKSFGRPRNFVIQIFVTFWTFYFVGLTSTNKSFNG